MQSHCVLNAIVQTLHNYAVVDWEELVVHTICRKNRKPLVSQAPINLIYAHNVHVYQFLKVIPYIKLQFRKRISMKLWKIKAFVKNIYSRDTKFVNYVSVSTELIKMRQNHISAGPGYAHHVLYCTSLSNNSRNNRGLYRVLHRRIPHLAAPFLT